MNDRRPDARSTTQLLEEIERLQFRLQEAEETLEAIRSADVDALVVAGPQGEQVFSITGAEHIYRVIVETMNEAALTVDPNGTILFCNQRFCDLLQTPIQTVMGRKVTAFVARPQQLPLRALLANAQASPVQRRLTLRAANGAAVPVQLAASPLAVTGGTSVCLVATDLTELEASAKSIRVLREHEQAMQEANEHLQMQAEELEEQTEELRVQTDELAAANAALRQSEQRLRLAQQAGRVGVFDRDLQNNTAVWTPELEELFGIPAGTFEGKPGDWAKRVHPEDLPRMRSFLQEWIQSERTEEAWEYRFIRADGPVRWIEGRGRIFRDPNGKPLRLIGTNVDITERKRAEEALRESEERLKRTQGIAHLGSWELDLVNNHLSWSDEVYRIFGLQPAEFHATYEAFLEAVHPDDRAAVDAAYSGSLREGRDTYEIEHRIVRRSTGEIRIVHEKCEHLRDASGRIIRSVGMVHDITDRKQAEEALRDLTRTLESKVAQRTAELQYRARQLQRLTLELSETEDRERRQLAEILHDDLQQELAAAKFQLSLLNSRARYDPSQQSLIAQVDEMLMDAIQKSRSLSHELSPAVLYHADFAGALHWLADQVHSKHGLEVAVDTLGDVPVESEAIKSFLYKTAQELLFNVVKHARVNQARIRVRRFGRCICLSVSDRGRGFDPQDVRQAAGFGLLSIRERIELLGGRMKMHSVKGHGSTFHIVVADSPEPEERGPKTEDSGQTAVGVGPRAYPTSPTPGSHGGLPLRVLVADDHQIVREGLISLLADEHDIEVVGEAANGREAVNQAYRLQPEVVIMDVAMPLINGDDATRQIKMHLPAARVIALSMYEEPDMVEKMRRAGAEGYILKTAPSEELLAAIRGKGRAGATT